MRCGVVDRRLIQVPLQSDGLASNGFPFHLRRAAAAACRLSDRPPPADKHYCLVNRSCRATRCFAFVTSTARHSFAAHPRTCCKINSRTSSGIWRHRQHRPRDLCDANERRDRNETRTTRERDYAWRHDDRLPVTRLELEMVVSGPVRLQSHHCFIRYVHYQPSI